MTTTDLIVTCAEGHPLMHLATWTHGPTLCGLRSHDSPSKGSLRTAGCRTCLDAALERGHIFAVDQDGTFINLARLGDGR